MLAFGGCCRFYMALVGSVRYLVILNFSEQ